MLLHQANPSEVMLIFCKVGYSASLARAHVDNLCSRGAWISGPKGYAPSDALFLLLFLFHVYQFEQVIWARVPPHSTKVKVTYK